MNNSKKAKLRHEKIRDLLQKNDVMKIQDLCRICDVSIATIRNDLTYLEKIGVLKRVIGGAVSTEGTCRDTIYASRINLFKEEKEKIARYVVDHIIEKNMTICLDAGTTNQYIAQALMEKDIPCKVITNASNILSTLIKSKNIEIHLIGGKLNKEHNAFFDRKAIEQAEQYKTDIYFLSPNGIDSHCISLSSRQEAIIKRIFIENANKVIVVADHSKFNRNAGNYLMDVEDVDEFISDTTIDG
ncbi:MAG: DeoR/GlpR family DNA-binding transcription regulator [Floccifex porci]|uniref:DeoR/GlpR family DNA-binding transcription regulator n=1 Tax=Floccifex porci TaxID=2606629 RepID=UPI0023F3C0AB|nr:DeoR/GlpR family DNA-binding transcription regulator [Floccifex porci]MDD7466559.1 DeoR/GlpR family DNA-binding transcription regulator [Floccifex porci]MDY4796565.1 DeoR/GlpR family DNA-binding transcription regulator [Floccifex porci]